MNASLAWTCPTCSKTVTTPFCPQCGERPLRPRDLTLRGLAEKLFHAVTSIDGRLLRTVWTLLSRPGLLTLAYMDGRRKPYIAPIPLFLVANVLFFAIQSLTNANIFGAPLASHLHHQDWSALARSLVTQHLERTHRTLELYAPVFDSAVVLNAKSLIVLMAAPFALLLPLLFFQRRLPFTTHVVFSLHLYAFLLLVFSLAILVAMLDVLVGGAGLKSARMDNALSVGILLVCAVYVYLATGRVYGSSGVLRVLKAVVLAFAVGVLVLGYRFLLLLITLYGT